MNKIVYLLLATYLFAANPLLDYKLDECHWDDNNDTYEVYNDGSEGSDYNASGGNGANTILESVLCKSADMISDDDHDKYMIAKNNLSLPNKYTLTVWIKTPLDDSGHKEFVVSSGGWFGGSSTSYYYYNIADISGSDNDFIYFKYNIDDDKWSLCIEGDCKDFNPNSLSDGWHHFAFSVEKSSSGGNGFGFGGGGSSSTTTFYLDGEKNTTFDTAVTGDLGLIFNSDYKSDEDDTPNGQSIGADTDEFKIFDDALDDSEVADVYNNEKDGKNWDGSERICNRYDGAITEIEMAADTFTTKNTFNDPTWTHVIFPKVFSETPVVFIVADNEGSDPASVRMRNITTTGFDVMIVEPQGNDGPHVSQTINYVAINPGLHILDGHLIEVGTISTKKVQGKRAPRGSDKGWSEITTKGHFCNPAIVSNIQTLVNEENDIPNEYSAPWMTSVIESNSSGIYVALDMSETNDGLIDSNETVGYMIADGNFTGTFTDDNDEEVKFEVQAIEPYFIGWDDGCKKVSFLNDYSSTPLIAGWKTERLGNNGGWFRRCYLDDSEVGFVVDEDKAKDNERKHIKEPGALFAFSKPFTLNLGASTSTTTTTFDSWDTFRSISDRNISTKIVNKPFEVNVSYVDDGDNEQEFNGTVCSIIIDSKGNEISDWNKTDFRADKSKYASFNVAHATKRAQVKMEWIENEDKDCPLNTSNSSTSTDYFAIRPLRFSIDNYPTNVYAGEDFNISLHGLDYNGVDATDYNETNATSNPSFKIKVQEINTSCINGDFTIKDDNITFLNGVNNTIANYDEVGVFDINLTDEDVSCGYRFAGVDCKDKNVTDYWNSDTNTSIDEVNVTIEVKPYDLNLTFSKTNKDWIYMDSNLSEFNFEINVTIKAYAKDSSTPLQNFDKGCYAKDVNISFNIDDNIINEFNGSYSINSGNSTYSSDINFSDTNFTAFREYNWTVVKDDFVKGEGNLSFVVNIDRNYSKPVSIVDLNITEINITTPEIAKNENNISVDKNLSFYYGRFYPTDIGSNEKDVTKLYPVVVYDENNNHFGEENMVLINWFKQVDNDINSTSALGSSLDYTYNSDKNVSDFNVSVKFQQPEFNVTINNGSDNNKFVVVHFKTPEYLWYSRYKDYNDSNDSTCSTHYCLEYMYEQNKTTTDVGSGTFIGSEVNLTKPSKKPTGIRVYR